MDVESRKTSTKPQRLAGLHLSRYSIFAVVIVAALATIALPGLTAPQAESGGPAHYASRGESRVSG